MRRLLLATAILFAAVAARADGTTINVDSRGVAIDGYDTVSYFQPTGVRRGKEEHSTVWQGATWWFSTPENLALFVAEPERYAPQYGGWCAFALSEGEFASDTDPREGYTVVDGRLYLNWSRRVKMRWEPDAAERIPVSDVNWPAIEAQLLDGTAKLSLLPED